MRAARPTFAVAAVLAIATAACGPDREPDATAEADRSVAQSAGELPSELLEQLKMEYRVLREEPAPEPTPSADADPANVPDRVRNRAGDRVLETVTGEATFYADKFEGRRTASGIPFRQNQMVAAHRAFPFGTILKVTNLRNERSVNVRVVDRGPFGGSAKAQRTVIDLSRRAATELGFISAGRAQVRVEVLEWGDGLPRA